MDAGARSHRALAGECECLDPITRWGTKCQELSAGPFIAHVGLNHSGELGSAILVFGDLFGSPHITIIAIPVLLHSGY